MKILHANMLSLALIVYPYFRIHIFACHDFSASLPFVVYFVAILKMMS